MAKFTTRVELHSTNDEDYTALHAAMQEQGFTRTIASSDGTLYSLPTAEYSYEGDSTAVEVREKARVAANSTGKPNWILVTEAITRTWYLGQA